MKKIIDWTLILLIFAGVTLLGNMIGYDIYNWGAVLGILILITIALLGMIMEEYIPLNIPAVGYIALIGIFISIPWFPGSGYIVEWTSQIELLAITTPILAYAGISIGRNWMDFKEMGWKSLVVAILVFIGTFLGSALIAEIVLRVQGII
ncbi:hypothetical protein ACFOU0_14090 [Salinicoccus sesuvii]|uniref:DUF340 domain-containing protein n=1 Tax=Salinicoccus sesuvii TaxID=868281 RepID=A0ABV7N240_9STAP